MAETGADGWLAVIRVLVAEDARQVRETLVALLGLEDDIEVAAVLASGDQVVPAALEHRPDVALLDIGLPGTDGIAAAAELASRLPGCRVLILTGMAAPAALSAALRAGVSGYLLKDGSAERLIGAVRAVARGDQVIDARLAARAPDWRQGPPPKPQSDAARCGMGVAFLE
jgi:two-component system, NarL family, response regulator DesR